MQPLATPLPQTPTADRCLCLTASRCYGFRWLLLLLLLAVALHTRQAARVPIAVLTRLLRCQLLG